MGNPELAAAQGFEDEALRSPEDREILLVEAALAWQRAGEMGRAVALLTGLIDDGDDEFGLAQNTLVDVYLNAGDDQRAKDELAKLWRRPGLTYGPCELTAELLAGYGDLKEALRWYDRAIALFTSEEMARLREPGGLATPVGHVAHNRRDVRRRLGLAPDVLDETAPRPQDDPGDEYDGPVQTRFFVYPRDEYAKARQLWPADYSEPEDDYFARYEAHLREVRDEGMPTVLLGLAKTDDLIAYAEMVGESPDTSAMRSRFAAALPADATLRWPPARNEPCWCGSGRKYKKCCGRPG